MNIEPKMKFGLIGLGKWGRVVEKTFLCHDTKLGELAWTTGRQWPWPTEEVDALFVATPYSTHERYLHYACEVGLPIILEKPFPLAPWPKRATPLLVNHVHLFNPLIEKMRAEATKDGAQVIGFNYEHGNIGPVREDCSSLLDYGSHGVAMAVWLTNSLEWELIDASSWQATNGRNYELHFSTFNNGPRLCAMTVGNAFPYRHQRITCTNTKGERYIFETFDYHQRLTRWGSDGSARVLLAESSQTPLGNAIDSFVRWTRGETANDSRFGWELPIQVMKLLTEAETVAGNSPPS